eukprot:COSAG06_NODE_84_length_25090_cov_20.561042_31_plen_230_part_00
MIILPRQARDKHRGNSKADAFSYRRRSRREAVAARESARKTPTCSYIAARTRPKRSPRTPPPPLIKLSTRRPATWSRSRRWRAAAAGGGTSSALDAVDAMAQAAMREMEEELQVENLRLLRRERMYAARTRLPCTLTHIDRETESCLHHHHNACVCAPTGTNLRSSSFSTLSARRTSTVWRGAHARLAFVCLIWHTCPSFNVNSRNTEKELLSQIVIIFDSNAKAPVRA